MTQGCVTTFVTLTHSLIILLLVSFILSNSLLSEIISMFLIYTDPIYKIKGVTIVFWVWIIWLKMIFFWQFCFINKMIYFFFVYTNVACMHLLLCIPVHTFVAVHICACVCGRWRTMLRFLLSSSAHYFLIKSLTEPEFTLLPRLVVSLHNLFVSVPCIGIFILGPQQSAFIWLWGSASRSSCPSLTSLAEPSPQH